MRASGSPFHPPSKSQQAPCFDPETITRKEPLAPHRNSRPFRVSGGPSRPSARAAMDERNAGRNSSRIEGLSFARFGQFRCAADAHRCASVRRTHAVKSRSNSRAPARAISTPRGHRRPSWVIETSNLMSPYSPRRNPAPALLACRLERFHNSVKKPGSTVLFSGGIKLLGLVVITELSNVAG
jgi:hypothetical protein